MPVETVSLAIKIVRFVLVLQKTNVLFVKVLHILGVQVLALHVRRTNMWSQKHVRPVILLVILVKAQALEIAQTAQIQIFWWKIPESLSKALA
jgi:hypothetical protein